MFSDLTNEEKLDIVSEIIEPASKILANKELGEMYKTEKSKAKLVSAAIKNNKKEIIEILAAIERKPVEEYKLNIFSLPMKVLEILNDPDLQEVFSSQGQTEGAKSSGSATGSAAEN